jgi:hypothetical protein
MDCPHARPRVTDEELDTPLEHQHVVGFGNIQRFAF